MKPTAKQKNGKGATGTPAAKVTTRVTVWNEYVSERNEPVVASVYPQGIHHVLAGFLKNDPGVTVRTATLEEPEHGLSDAILNETDVLVWWGHRAHDRVSDAVVERVRLRVLDGMGFIALHSSHWSKPFKRLMGTSCALCHRVADERERLWVVDPGHEIACGIDPYIELERSEMYGEPFGVPPPEETVFISWFQGGEVFRSGCCWRRGSGRVFYFAPGHQTYPIYHNPQIQRVIANAVQWSRPRGAPLNSPRRVDIGEARERVG